MSMMGTQPEHPDDRLYVHGFVSFQHGQGVVYPLFMSTVVIQRKAI